MREENWPQACLNLCLGCQLTQGNSQQRVQFSLLSLTVHRECDAGKGSGSVTSRAACTRLARSAASRSSELMRGPRPALIIRAPCFVWPPDTVAVFTAIHEVTAAEDAQMSQSICTASGKLHCSGYSTHKRSGHTLDRKSALTMCRVSGKRGASRMITSAKGSCASRSPRPSTPATAISLISLALIMLQKIALDKGLLSCQIS